MCETPPGRPTCRVSEEMRAETVDVVIVGGGPTGLMLAAELRLGGLDPVVLERLPEISEIPKGNGLVGQIVPMLDYRGLREAFAAGSTWAGPIPRFSFGPLELDFSRVGVSPLHIMAIPHAGGSALRLGGSPDRSQIPSEIVLAGWGEMANQIPVPARARWRSLGVQRAHARALPLSSGQGPGTRAAAYARDADAVRGSADLACPTRRS
jgi:choline dehydrogenase-like flavoprotein